jgi:hypothetical protein
MIWQPIDTAPLTGEAILLYLDQPIDMNAVVAFSSLPDLHIVVGWAYSYGGRQVEWNCGFCEEGCADSYGISSSYMMDVKPTHWMHLPKAPAGARS